MHIVAPCARSTHDGWREMNAHTLRSLARAARMRGGSAMRRMMVSGSGRGIVDGVTR